MSEKNPKQNKKTSYNFAAATFSLMISERCHWSSLSEVYGNRTMDSERHLNKLGLTCLLALEFSEPPVKKKGSGINLTGTHCCEPGCLNVTLLIPVPKVQHK